MCSSSPSELITTSPYANSRACIFRRILLPFKQLVILEISYLHGLKDLRHPFDTRKWFSTPKTACSHLESFKRELSRDFIRPSEKKAQSFPSDCGRNTPLQASSWEACCCKTQGRKRSSWRGGGQMGVRSVCGGKRCGSFRSSPYLSVIIGDVTQIQGNLHIPLTDSIWIMQLRGKK